MTFNRLATFSVIDQDQFVLKIGRNVQERLILLVI